MEEHVKCHCIYDMCYGFNINFSMVNIVLLSLCIIGILRQLFTLHHRLAIRPLSRLSLLSNSANWWRKPSLGRISRWSRTLLTASVAVRPSLIIRYDNTQVLDLDIPITQCTNTLPGTQNHHVTFTLLKISTCKRMP